MDDQPFTEKLVEEKVTYTLLKEGEFYLVQDVPARVNVETGEQLFAPETVMELQRLFSKEEEPVRYVQTAVYQFTS
jgi:hypothetical protein